jgi:hypothetical protein
MENFVEQAYAIGGAWGVATLVLCYAVVYLYRAREREHKERLREVRENSKLMARLLDTASKRSVPPNPLPLQSIPPLDENWDDEPTVLTHVRQQQVRELVIRYLDNE